MNNLSALLDTGAYIPVWTDAEEILVSGLGATLVKKDVPFTGFGGVAYGNLYQVTIKVGDLIFPNMHIVANSELNNSYNLILSATMFDGLIYEINTKTHKLNITVPNDRCWYMCIAFFENIGNSCICVQPIKCWHLPTTVDQTAKLAKKNEN